MLLLLLLLGCVAPPTDDDDDDATEPPPIDGPAFERVDALPEPGRGGGIAVQDLDGDGLPEVFVADFDGSRLHRNLGDWTFEPWPSEPWLDGRTIFDHWGATFADLDRDGDADLLIHTAAADEVWRNDGGVFTALPDLPALGITFALSLADVDGDGVLDLYSTTHVGVDDEGFPTGKEGPDALLLGVGDGTFVDATDRLPQDAGSGRGFCGRFSDWDHDGDPDLYLVNERPPGSQSNHLMRNDGGSFTLVDEGCFCDVSVAGMGQGIGDYDRDGWQDLYMTNTRFSDAVDQPAPGNGEILLRNTGDLSFVDTSLSSNARIGGWEDGQRTISWGAEFLDVDNDGWQDLYVSFGPFVEDPDSPQPNALARNVDGVFEPWADSGAEWDGEGRAVVPADLDADGCIDVIVGQVAGPTLLYRNRCVDAQNWLQLDLGELVGAVALVTADGVTQRQEVFAGAVHASPWKVLHFGLGDADEAAVEVRWPDGSTSEHTLASNARHRLDPS